MKRNKKITLRMLPLRILRAFTILCLANGAIGYNILFMGPFPAPSHWMWLEHFQKDLLERGHHITSVNNHPTKQPHPNLTEIIIDPMFDIPHYLPVANIFTMLFSSDFDNLKMWWNVGVWTSEHALNDRKVKALIASKDQQFDLVILEQFFHESFLMFGHKFKCPVVTIGTMGYADYMDHSMGLLTPWSVIPHLLLPHTDQMSFKQRFYNSYLSLYDAVMRRWSYMPKMQEMAERHFSQHLQGPLPHVRDLEKNISLMLINSHRSVDIPRPSMPGLVNVGGAHIKPAKPLPKDLEHFIETSSNGVIYFSLGSYVKSIDMPADRIGVLLNAFGKLPQNVLWKYENDSLTNLPPNVMIRKWMPQNDILAHPNVKLFITHGGIFGSQEGLYWAKPMLCLPLYGDQHRNTIKSVRAGYARTLNLATMTAEDLQQNIQALVADPQYKLKAMEMSQLFRENPLHPLDEASYWIEYVAKYKGAPFLKSHGAFMPLHQYLLLDVLAVLLAAVIVAIVLPLLILRELKRLIRKFSKEQTMTDSKEKKLE
ncbi:UDP-glycosyltransferase UGT5 isoform X1 [Stomoxys calcitrans]|uniref:UDP-glycosyltransferase UGT5 isoform X1 n=2 Tax=Stomoxys calcitrans TaxID=35570 RepID=UPI0027E2D85D|nr:UDP-glycosyltransferase UGT5 isoform X1 [Stomoxys calcitrans]